MIRCKEALLKTKVHFKKLASIEFNDSEDPEKSADVKERLQKMELLAEKLKVQLIMCASGVILSVALYSLFWYHSQCRALPFQESPCKQSRALPSIPTNQSTLAEAVDEFIFALRSQTIKFHNAILMNDQVERRRLSNSTKAEIAQLMHQHSVDLVAFGALKQEDHRLEILEFAILGTYFEMLLHSIVISIFTILMAGAINNCELSEISENDVSSAEESENSQNARLKQLKRQIPVLYTTTLIFIVTGVTLYSMYIAGHYFSGSSPALYDSTSSCNCDYLNFLTTLELALNKRFLKLDNAMESPVLEVRQSIWQYESEAIETAIEFHLGLKKYTVDRRTMPRKITRNKPLKYDLFVLLLMIISLGFYVTSVASWASVEGSVWRVFKCVRICIPVSRD